MNEEIKVNVSELSDEELMNATGAAGSARWITYTVVRGDTLIKIGNRFGVSVGQLCSWNGISNPDYIQAGQRLNIYTSR